MRKPSFIALFLVLTSFPFLGIRCVTFNSGGSSGDGGIFRSITAAETWEPRSFIRQEKKKIFSLSNDDILSIAFDPIDPTIMYVGTNGRGIFQTNNQGESWTQTGMRFGAFPSIDIHPTNPKTLIAASQNTLLQSLDQGLGWQIIYSESAGKEITGILYDRYNPDHIIATTFDGAFLMSRDQGVNWEVISRLPTEIVGIAMNPGDTRILYARTIARGLYKTQDQGKTWNNVTEIPLKSFRGSQEINDIALIQQRPDSVLIATKAGLFLSKDGGATWDQVKTLLSPTAPAIRHIALDSINPFIYYFSIDRIIHKTTDNGATWKVIEDFPSQRSINVLKTHPATADIVFAGMLKLKKK